MSVIWNAVILSPMINVLAVLYALLLHNFGLAIIVFTLLVRLATLRLTQRQLRSTKKMQEIQPKIQEIRRKYPDDRQKASQAQMRLMKEAGVNPIGCLGPMVIQFPIWIGLYQSIISLLPHQPGGAGASLAVPVRVAALRGHAGAVEPVVPVAGPGPGGE